MYVLITQQGVVFFLHIPAAAAAAVDRQQLLLRRTFQGWEMSPG
jgi:hypothetical protein